MLKQSITTNLLLTQHVFEYDGCPIYYHLAGSPERPLVVFTHGAAMDHRMFKAQIPVVAQHYRVLLWDVRGHGQSRPDGGDFSIRRAVDDLRALLDRLGYEQAAFVGHSMGGYISQELLFHYPERVMTLVTINSSCLTLKHSSPTIYSMRWSPLLFSLIPYSLLVWVAALYITVTAEVRAYVEQVLSRHTKKEFITIWAAVMNCLHEEPDYHVQQPVLATYGQNDPLGFGLMKRQAQIWSRQNPNCRCVEIPRAGHNAHQENPGFFNRILLDFLAEHVPTPEIESSKGTDRCLE
jgi:3-oxoadipate enol-lactonase